MSASRAPAVQESNGKYAVAIAPGVRFTVDPDKKLRCSVKSDVPRTLKSYELVDIDERTDIISFPMQ
jgi:hypothetical protein